MNDYDRQLLLDNVYNLARKRNIKIGDVEKSAELSAGYLSKLNSEENKTNPSIEIVCKLAKYFNVTVDDLLFQKHSDMTPDEEEILAFIINVCNSTKAGKLHWQRRSARFFQNLESDRNTGNTNLPMVFGKYDAETNDYYNCYYSEVHPDYPFVFAGDSFSASIGTDCTLFLMNVSPALMQTVKTFYLELIIVRAKKRKTVCVSEKGSNSVFRQPLNQLFGIAENSDAHSNPDQPVKAIMRMFLSGEKIEKSNGLDGWDDDLPF